MKTLVWTALVGLAVAPALLAQDSGWTETRFHRIYLRNGNFLDGIVVQDTPTQVILKVKAGELGVRKDQIAKDEDGKYLVVVMKMRSYNEKPVLTDVKKEERPVRTETPLIERPSAVGQEKRDWKEPHPTGTKQEQLAAYVEGFRDVPLEKREALLQTILGFGKEAVLLLASSLPRFDEGNQGVAASAIIDAREPETLPIIRKHLEDKSPSVRSNAAYVLGSIGDGTDLPKIRALLKDEDSGVRSFAVGILGKMKDRDSFGSIVACLKDSDPFVRKKAFEAMGAIAAQHDMKEDLQRAILESLDGLSGAALVDMIKLAGGTKDKNLGPAMTRFLSHDNAQVRAQALIALADIADPATAEQILPLFESEREYWPRIQLAGAAGSMKLAKAVDYLARWLGEEDTNIQAAASRALRQITGQNFGLDQDRWMKWWEGAKPR